MGQPNQLQLRIAQPCHQSWAAMVPTGPGRHCAACQKVVVDFTQKTDAEILAYLARAGSQPCGRFRAGQLARPLQPAVAPRPWRSWVASVLALGGVLGSGRAAAQTNGYFSGGPTPTVAQPRRAPASEPNVPAGEPEAAAPLAAAPPSSAGEPAVVRGVVTDAASGERLPGVTVLLNGTALGTSTDAQGEFQLALPPHLAADTLRFAYVGYSGQDLPAASLARATPVVVRLAADVMGMGEVVVAGAYVQRPYPWHPRAFYNWGMRWLARPFRKQPVE